MDAQVSLGAMYAKGVGVPINEQEGVRWTLMAANCDSAAAQWNMALAFINGIGVRKDPIEAAKWMYLSARVSRFRAAHPNGKKATEEIERILSPAQVQMARKLSIDWQIDPLCGSRQ
jgi:TPR repeat protein